MSEPEASSKTIQPLNLRLRTCALKLEAVLNLRHEEWMQKAQGKAAAKQINKRAFSSSLASPMETQFDAGSRVTPMRGTWLAYRLLGQNPFREKNQLHTYKAGEDPRDIVWKVLFRKVIENCEALVDRYGCAPVGLSDVSVVERWSLDFFPRAFDTCASALLDLITVTPDLADYSQLLWRTRYNALSEAESTLRTTFEAENKAAASAHGGFA